MGDWGVQVRLMDYSLQLTTLEHFEVLVYNTLGSGQSSTLFVLAEGSRLQYREKSLRVWIYFLFHLLEQSA